MALKENSLNYIGKTYNFLIVLAEAGRTKWGLRRVFAKCVCGVEKSYCLTDLKNGHTKSCGCKQKELIRIIQTKHGYKKHPLYSVWGGIKQRCYNKNSPAYPYYGGRGIKVCREWKIDFMSFCNWALINGWEHGLTVDRFPNNDGNYEPSNCRIATVTQQNRNKSGVKFIKYNNETKCLSEWAIYLNMKSVSLNSRLKSGWPIEKAFTTPIRER